MVSARRLNTADCEAFRNQNFAIKKEKCMSDLQTLLERNQKFAAEYKGGLNSLPKFSTFILTCADARVDPAYYLGLELGDALVFRTGGGRVTDDVERPAGRDRTGDCARRGGSGAKGGNRQSSSAREQTNSSGVRDSCSSHAKIRCELGHRLSAACRKSRYQSSAAACGKIVCLLFPDRRIERV